MVFDGFRSGGAAVTGYVRESPVVKIPARTDYGKRVTSIDDRAFYDNQLTSVTIGANVDIGDSFDGGFKDVYNNGGRRAGTYPSSDGERWRKQ